MQNQIPGDWSALWHQFKKHRLGYVALYVIIAFALVGIYAPILASSKPLCVYYNGTLYFPLFRYLFFTGFYTKNLDIFFNLLIFTLPCAILIAALSKPYWKLWGMGILIFFQIGLFLFLIFKTPQDPASDKELIMKRQAALQQQPLLNWSFDLLYMNDYAKLNLILKEQQREHQHKTLSRYGKIYKDFAALHGMDPTLPTLWQMEATKEKNILDSQKKILENSKQDSPQHLEAQATIDYILERRDWIQTQIHLLKFQINPLLRPFHWEDDAGGEPGFNQFLNSWELTRINGKDLTAALLFGIRISMTVGLIAVAISLSIGIPIGSFAGYYGGTFDIIVSRLLEIWEAMPTFFMLLLVIAITQSKSIFLVIAVIGIFGWTSFSRFIRGEFFKQRNLSYVEACRALGFNDHYIMFTHILPNSIPPILTLLPFAIMGAITSEAGLSFLGLGEEGSCSWGVLMDEGRSAFPGESYLLWPPAILLTILLVAIALVGDSLRDALDPKMHR